MHPALPALNFDAELLTATCERIGARMVVLFGSYASGSPPPGPDSDIDIAVRWPRGDAGALWDCMQSLAAVFPGRSLDLVLLPTDDPLLRWEIMRDGALLYGSIDEFLECAGSSVRGGSERFRAERRV